MAITLFVISTSPKFGYILTLARKLISTSAGRSDTG